MYCLSDKQIDFILSDIRARGVGMESLQQDLLDHVCCLIEQNLEAGGDFEGFYSATIRTFYKDELKEIEDETLFLLTNKNYYTMKKVMLASGAFSAIVLSFGILFKFMHWPGSGTLLVLGIVLFSLLFLPLLFTLKVKEKQQTQDKFILTIGTLSAIFLSLGILFKIMHWPLANALGASSVGIMVLLFLPVYFFTGIKNSETKVNTIVTSIIIVAGAGLFMSLVRSPGGSSIIYKLNTSNFVRNEQILKNEQAQLINYLQANNAQNVPSEQSQQINKLCEELKAHILEKETGYKTLGTDFERKNAVLSEGWVKDYFEEESPATLKLIVLRKLVETYNATNSRTANPNFQPIPIEATILDRSEERVLPALNSFIQIQMLVLQNDQQLLACK
jgi:hypothetical protein